MSDRAWELVIALLIAVTIVALTATIADGCDAKGRGYEGNDCYPNKTCNVGLSCVKPRVANEHSVCAKEGGQ